MEKRINLPPNHSIKRNRGENPKELTLETGHYLSPGWGGGGGGEEGFETKQGEI